MPPPDELLMIVDPETKEAFRVGEDPATSGPLFFTSRAALERYADEEGILEFAVHAVPAGVLARMKNRPHWVDGEARGLPPRRESPPPGETGRRGAEGLPPADPPERQGPPPRDAPRHGSC